MQQEDQHIRKGFMYQAHEDQDIQDWFDSLPSRKHSEYIRKAIRHFIETNENDNTIIPCESDTNETNELEQIKIRLTEVESQLSRVLSQDTITIEDTTQSKEGKYVNAPSILQNLGR